MRRKVGKMKPSVKVYLVLLTLGVIYYLFERFPIINPLVLGLFLLVVGSVASAIIYLMAGYGKIRKTKVKDKKSRLPKDEAARYEKLKELEERTTRSHELWINNLTGEDKKETKKEFRPFG